MLCGPSYLCSTLERMQSQHLFFSIIIPAHNEEKYIEETLLNIRALDYPANRFEVIVVENGSSDRTLEAAKKYDGGVVTVVSSPTKGVSAAKNLGVQKSNKEGDWTIFLDADTVLKRSFLSELDAFLTAKKSKNYSVGTTGIKPIPDSAVARAWFAFYDIGHRLTKASYALQIVRTDVLRDIRFDEHMVIGEDIVLIEQAMQRGNFFFLPTKTVYTSTRRFESEGWWKIFFSWTFVAMLPPSLKRRFDYKVVR